MKEKGISHLDDSTVTISHDSSEPSNRPDQIARQETAALHGVKLCFLLVVFLSVVGFAIGTYINLTKAEEREFRANFEDYANKVLDAIGASMEESLGGIDLLAHDITSFAEASNKTWPFVTVPDFAERAAQLMTLSHALHVSLAPLVTEDSRQAWEDYASKNTNWVLETFGKQGVDLDTFQAQDVIYGIDTDDTPLPHEPTSSTGPWLPKWQNFPVNIHTALYNEDLFQVNAGPPARHMLRQGSQAIISSPEMLPDPEDPATLARAKTFAEWAKFYTNGVKIMEPMSSILYPVMWENLSGAITSASRRTESALATATVQFPFYWRDLLVNILHNGSNGVVVVFYNSCSVPFTYQINGPDVEYLGRGDLHETKFDYLYSESAHSLAFDSTLRQDHGVYSGLPLDTGFCPTTLRVFPSTHMMNENKTSEPILYTSVILLIFAVTSSVFFLYDFCVERRQRKVLFSVLESATSANVLEHKVRKRTVKLEDKNRQLAAANRQVVKASELQLQHFACMSHEIRTPLNCIIGCSSLLQDTELDSMQLESLQMINASGDLLLSVVNDVLDFSSLESGDVEIDVQRTSIQNALDSVVFSMRAKAELQTVTLQTLYGLDVPEFMDTDTRRLQQILYNLLGNAVKFSKTGGQVELAVSVTKESTDNSTTAYTPPCRDADAPLVDISSQRNPRYLKFVVKDYGKGLRSNDFAKIFQPFQQESAETEKVYGGTGLGLAITTKLVHRMGGQISVDSELGKWARFSVHLPLSESRIPTCEKAAQHLKGVRVVLVTEQNEHQKHVASIFCDCKLELQAHRTLAEAVASSPVDDEKKYLFLVEDRLFDAAAWKKSPQSAVLLTFGPEANVNESRGHFRSFVDTIPQVFVRQVAEFYKAAKDDPHPQESFSSVSNATHHSNSSYGSAPNNLVPYGKLSVLVAEDNLVNQKVMGRILSRLGVEDIEIVENGQLAVDREAQKKFDVILLDMQMPVMDGIDACRIIQKRGTAAKIAFVTAHALNQYEEECYAAGATEFLTKPCNVKSVDNCFQRLMKKAAI